MIWERGERGVTAGYDDWDERSMETLHMEAINEEVGKSICKTTAETGKSLRSGFPG